MFKDIFNNLYQLSCRYFNITEGSRLVTPFTCHADAYPPAQYYWIFANEGENITRSTIGGKKVLVMKMKLVFVYVLWRFSLENFFVL